MGIIECGGKHTYSDHEKFVMRRDAAASAARQERTRLNQILNHASVKSGRLYKLGCFLALETDMGADEACATLDKAHQGNETVHPAASGYDAGRAAAQQLIDPESERRRIQAQNDAGYELELAKRGGRASDNRSDRDKQRDESFADLARGALNRKDDEPEDDDDNSKLRSMGFGGGAQFEQSAYAASAATAARLLGKPSATIAPRPANTPLAREGQVPARVAPSPDAAYAQGAESAKRFLFGTAAVRAQGCSTLSIEFQG